MDETRFVNVYIDSEALIREINLKVEPETWVRCVIGFGIGLSGFAIGFVQDWWLSMLVGSFIAIYGFLRFLEHIVGPKRLMAKIRKENGGDIPTATLEMGEKLTHSYRGVTMTVLFSDVQKVYFLDRSIYLQAERWYLTVDRKGFVKGNAGEFEDFLREKCKNAEFYHSNYNNKTDK